MSKLETIKERLKQDFYVKSHPSWGKDESGADDVSYLLQRLEIAQTALEQFSDESNWMGKGKETYPQSGIIEWDGEENPIKLANEALKE